MTHVVSAMSEGCTPAAIDSRRYRGAERGGIGAVAPQVR